MSRVVALEKGNLFFFFFLSSDENGAQLKNHTNNLSPLMLGFSEGCLRDILEMHVRVFKTSQRKAIAAVQSDFQNQKC